jgi:hypothetical protein
MEMAGRLVQKQARDNRKGKKNKQHNTKTQNTQNRKQKYNTKTKIKRILKT